MEYAPVLAYIADYWPSIMRHNPREQGTLIGLPRPYLVPSAAGFFQEMYYWDSYFMALGVVGTAHEDVILDMVENMLFLYRRFAVIPNASRYYFLSRSQPPFLTRLIWLGYEVKTRRGDADAGPYLRASHARGGSRARVGVARLGTPARPAGGPRPVALLRHQSPRHSSPRVRVGGTTPRVATIAGWNTCRLISTPSSMRASRTSRGPRRRWTTRAARRTGATCATARADTMRRLMWDEAEGSYFDYDFANQARNPHASLAAFYTLWAGVASPEEAARMVERWLPRFEQPGGLVSTLVERAGRQWAWPNGWAPLQWLAVQGLLRYGYEAEAARVMRKWCDNCATVFAATGGMWEKYNVVEVGVRPESGLYGTVPGFGWSNAVFADFARLLGVSAATGGAAVAPPAGAQRSRRER